MASSHPVFVVGAPRTGTTLAREILNRHPRIHLFDEVHFFERVWDDRKHLGSLSSPRSQLAAIHRVLEIVRSFGADRDVAETLTVGEYRRRLLQMGRRYRNLLRIPLEEGARRHGADVWGDSSPQDILYLDTILYWYPDARIVVLVRDPRAFLCSYKNYYRRGVSSYRERYNPLSASMLWRSYMSALLEAESKPYAEAVHRLRYEELVDDPEGTVRALCAHVGVGFDPSMLDVARTNSSFVPEGESAGQRGIVATSRERWRTELSRTELWVGERVYSRLREQLGYGPPLREGEGRLRPSPVELAGIALSLPVRLFNLLFRTQKPFTLSKFRRVMGLFRAS
jgi:omega-hydroxy-beta-dihydromenaquinone-9 sulfotransferase